MVEVFGITISQQVIAAGVVAGLVYATLAAGFVLIYRSTGVLNFAHGEMGFFGLAAFVLFIVNYRMNWWLAFFLAIAATAAVGMAIELIVVRRLFEAPRLVLLVATIGVGQILTLARVGWIPDITSGGTIPSAIDMSWQPTKHLRLGSAELTVLAVAPALIALLGVFMTKTKLGLGMRATASNPDTARVFGSSPKRVSTIVWTFAGAFAAATAILVAPLQAIGAATVDDRSNLLVEELLLKVLVVSLLAKMHSLPGVIWAGIGVGVVEKVVRANVASIDHGIVNLWFFVAVMVLVLWFVRSTPERANWALSADLRPIPSRLAHIWWVRNLNGIGFAFLFGFLALVPLFASSSASLLSWSNVLLFAMVAMSLTVLMGWAGQVSLGQFAFVGLGGLATLAFTQGHDVPIPFDFFDLRIDVPWGVAVVFATGLGVLVAILVGLPALVVRGLFLAVTTLAFAVMAGGWLFSRGFFSGGTTSPRPPTPPVLFGIDVGESRKTLYVVCLVSLAGLAWLVARVRRGAIGQSLIAVRDNEDCAASLGVAVRRCKLLAFALAGGIAAFCGALFVLVAPSLSPSTQFAPSSSLRVLIIAIVGGLGTVAGPILGSLWILGLEPLVPDQLRNLQDLLTSNIGLLVLLMYFPKGLVQAVHKLRNLLYRLAPSTTDNLPPPPTTVHPPPPPTHISPPPDHLLTPPDTIAGSATPTPTHTALLPEQLPPPPVTVAGTATPTPKYLSPQPNQFPPLPTHTALPPDHPQLDTVMGSTTPTSVYPSTPPDQTATPPNQTATPPNQTARPPEQPLPPPDHSTLPPEQPPPPPDYLLTPTDHLQPSPSDHLPPSPDKVAGSVTPTSDHPQPPPDNLPTTPGHPPLTPDNPPPDQLPPNQLQPTNPTDNIPPVTVEGVEGSPTPTSVTIEGSATAASTPDNLLPPPDHLPATPDQPPPDHLLPPPETVEGSATFTPAQHLPLSGEVEHLPSVGASPSAQSLAPSSHFLPDASQVLAPAVFKGGRKERKGGVGAQGEAVLRAKNITVRFGGNLAVNNVDFEVWQGELVGLIGTNGAGKSTLLNAIGGFVDCDGTVEILGADATKRSVTDRHRLGLGRGFQEAKLFPGLTVHETLMFALQSRQRSGALPLLPSPSRFAARRALHSDANEIIDYFELKDHSDTFLAELSTGTRRIVEFACLLAINSKVLLLDEPTAGMSQAETEAFGPLIKALHVELDASMVVIEHNMALVMGISDRVCCLDSGAVIANGTPDEVRNDPQVLASYLGIKQSA